MKHGSRKSFLINFICTICILGAFAITALVLANVGVRVYRNIVVENANNYKLRTSLSYVATKVRQMDESGSIYIEEYEGVDLLVMQHEYEGKTYKTFIYYYEGKLYELFQEKDKQFTLEDGPCGYEIMEIDSFTMKEMGKRVLCFTAQDGNGKKESLTLSLRTGS